MLPSWSPPSPTHARTHSLTHTHTHLLTLSHSEQSMPSRVRARFCTGIACHVSPRYVTPHAPFQHHNMHHHMHMIIFIHSKSSNSENITMSKVQERCVVLGWGMGKEGNDGDHNFGDKCWGQITPAHVHIHPHSHLHPCMTLTHSLTD